MNQPRTTFVIENREGKALVNTEGDGFGPLPATPEQAAHIVRSQLERHAKLGNSVIVTIRQVSHDTVAALEKYRKS